jgi:O-antigen/teichoic acid export membrane protein
MKLIAQNWYANPRYSRIFGWGKLITITGGAQAIVQGTGMLSGILIIRLLSTHQYAWYTLANTMLGTMTILSDAGISTGVMAQGGKVWQDKEKLGAVLATGLDLRRKMGFTSLIVVTPFLIYLLLQHSASWLTACLIVASLIPAYFTSLSDTLLEIVPKLHQDIVSLQKNQIAVSVGRLILSGLLLLVFPFPFIAILASGIARFYGNKGMEKISNSFVDRDQKPDVEIRKSILSIVKKILPGAIYFCLSGQITIWLVSIFGNTKSIAEVGALSRLTMILTFFSVIISTLIVPRFARLENNRRLLLTRFFQIVGILVLFSSFVIAVFWLFPEKFLFILGKDYMGLQRELVVNVIGSCITLIWGAIFTLYSSRGWILNPAVSIFLSLAAIISGLYLFDTSTVAGVLSLNIFIALVELAYHATYALYKIVRIK